jgi:hypothetical protein
VNEDQDPKSLSVLFVDYGEVKEIYPWKNECHKEIDFAEVPIQCVRCRLDNIVPLGGKYQTAFLDDVHASFVECHVRVSVIKPVSKFPLPVVIKAQYEDLRTPINIAKYFVSKK